MIFVTVGNLPFDRLVGAADELAAQYDEPVIIQRGYGSYIPESAEHVELVDETQFREWLSEARVVVSHAGAGSILCALSAGKPLVLAPRRAQQGEAIDDHQFELAAALSEEGQAVMVTDLSADSLARAIEQSAEATGGAIGAGSLRTFLRGWLAGQAARPSPRRRRPFPRRGEG